MTERSDASLMGECSLSLTAPCHHLAMRPWLSMAAEILVTHKEGTSGARPPGVC